MKKTPYLGLKTLRIGAVLLYTLILIKYIPLFRWSGSGPAMAFMMVAIFGLLMRGSLCIITAKIRLHQMKKEESTTKRKIMRWIGIVLIVTPALLIGYMIISN